MIRNPSIRPVANMVGREQIVLVEIYFGSISGSNVFISPAFWQIILGIAINQVSLGGLQFVQGDMTAVHEGNFMCADDSTHMFGHLSRSHIGAVGKRRDDIALIGMRQFGIRARDGSKMPREVEPLHSCPRGHPTRIDQGGSDAVLLAARSDWRERLFP